jgi:myo-inositol-1(or 4)-monophosphatase
LVDWSKILKDCSERIRVNVLKFFGSPEASLEFGVGAGGDIMKKIDLVAEIALTDVLEEKHVSYTLISEEAGIKKIGENPEGCYVTVDPVDGSTNAVRGLPFIATSIAVSKKPFLHEVEAAIVTDLYRDIAYTATLGRGAFRNGKKITPSKTSSLIEAMVGVDFKALKTKTLLDQMAPILERAKHIRHLGADALEMCYVADGTTDAFIDIRGKLRVTDVAAAYLILKEAGARIVTPEGKEINVRLAPTQRISLIAAANTAMYEKIAKLLTT